MITAEKMKSKSIYWSAKFSSNNLPSILNSFKIMPLELPNLKIEEPLCMAYALQRMDNWLS